jgi:hypothetical protein
MKVNSLNFQKMPQKTSLHSVMKASKFLIEKCFNFSKMDKKNVQKKIVQIFYGKRRAALPYFKITVWIPKK